MAYNASQAKTPVCYDLRKSQWTFDALGYRFYFSTMAHRDKFWRDWAKRVEWLSDSMSRRFHIYVDCSLLAVVQLYMQIEGRGFFVVDLHDGVVYEDSAEFTMQVVCDG